MRLLIIDDDFVRVDVISRYLGATTHVHKTLVPRRFTGFDVVSFDHDLGPEGDAYDAIRIIDPKNFPRDTIYIVHSMNPVGANNIRGLLEGYGLKVRVIPFGNMLQGME